MKVSKLLAFLFGVALLFSSTAFARENKTSLHLSDKVTVQGQSLKPGDYTVEWSGSAPAIQVTISQGKHVVATLSGHMTEQSVFGGSGTAYGTRAGSDGSESLTVIYPGGKKLALEFDQTAQATEAN